MTEKLEKATHSGELKIGNMVFPCSVLSDGTRILTQTDFMKGMDMYYSGWVAKEKSKDIATADIPHFMAFKSLEPYVDKHLGDLQSISVKYKTERGNIAHGIRAEIIPKICEIWMDADEGGGLGKRQKRVAEKAKLLMRALAHVGIVALVDEATGYQEERDRDALHKILEAYIAKELLPWAKKFPDEFYRQLFRLRGWHYSPMSVKRPQYVGKLTNKLIYEKLPKGVLDELRVKNPVTDKGYRRRRHHQFLTEDIGNPHLERHLAAVTALMRAAPNWKAFERLFERAYPDSRQQQIEMELEDIQDAEIVE